MEAIQDICAICLDIIRDSRAVLEECGHAFCESCIDKWTDIKLRCPVCNKELTMLSTAKTPENKVAVDTDEELECLDHGYFKMEFLKLQTQFNNTKLKMQKNHKLAHHPDSWSVLEMLGIEITQKIRVLTDLGTFNAKEYLEDTYRIDQSLHDLGNGNFVMVGFYSNHWGDEEDEYYDEYYEEGYYDEDYGYFDEDDDEDTFYHQRPHAGPNKRAKAKTSNNKKPAAGNNKSNHNRLKC